MFLALAVLALVLILALAIPTLDEINAGLKTKSEALVNVLDRIDHETSPTQTQLKCWNEERVGLEGEIKALNAEKEDLEARGEARKMAEGHLARLRQPANPMYHGGQPGSGGAGAKSLSAQFLESAGFKTWIGMHAPSGSPIPPSRSGARLPDSGPVTIEGGFKSLAYSRSGWTAPSDANANALVAPDHRGLVDMGTWMIPLGILDLIPREPTTAEIIFYTVATDGEQAAAPTREATAAGGSSGTKPEGGMSFDLRDTRVKTIPVWTPVTRQAMSDAAQLSSILETYLRYEVQRELTKQVLTGDGTGENFTGIKNLSGKLSQAFTTDILTTTRKARTKLLLEGRVVPTGWAMYPSDWEIIELLQDNEGRYYYGGPQQKGQPTLWGVPVTETEFATSGEPTLGAWNFARLVDREQTTLRVSDSHADFFVRNLLALLAELRAAFYVAREKAFCQVDIVE